MAGPDQRSPMSVGMDWAARISALGFEFALPPIGGYYLDQSLGSGPVGVLLGMVAGFGLGLFRILRIARDASRRRD